MPRPELPETSPSDPLFTSIAVLLVVVHQLLSLASAPSLRSPSAKWSSKTTPSRAARCFAAGIAEAAAAVAAVPAAASWMGSAVAALAFSASEIAGAGSWA